MSTLRIMIAAIFLSFSPFSVVSAENVPPHLVIIADHSGSMFIDSDMAIQTAAIIEALQLYFAACSDVTVSYIAWGGTANEPVVFQLHDVASRRQFVEQLTNVLSLQRIHKTMHASGIEKAISHVNNVAASRTVLIMITDGDGSSIDHTLPPATELIKISLGPGTVHHYMNKIFMPNIGTHYHADDSSMLRRVIQDAFASIADLCIG